MHWQENILQHKMNPPPPKKKLKPGLVTYTTGLSRTCVMKLKDFQAPVVFSRTFNALKLGEKNQVLSRMRGNPEFQPDIRCSLEDMQTFYSQTAWEWQPSALHFLCACTRQSNGYGRRSTDVIFSLWCPAHSQLYQKCIHRIGNNSNKRTHTRWKEAAKTKIHNFKLNHNAV